MLFFKKNIKKLFLLIYFICFIFFIGKIKVLAQCQFQLYKPVDTWLTGQVDCLDTYISALINWITGIVSALSTLLIVFAGYTYVTSVGNPDQIQKAKKLIMTAITSLIVVILARLIIKTIYPNL